MKVIFQTLVVQTLLLSVLLPAQELSGKKLRTLYYKASLTSHNARELYDSLASVDDSSDVLLLGYKGMASLLMAKHARFPHEKFKYFIEGRKTLDRAIRLAPENLELRFLRFTVQTNTPEFLGYYADIPEDKSIILSALRNQEIDEDLNNRIVEYLLQSPHCRPSEKQKIRANAP